jgi:hypothetical protein
VFELGVIILYFSGWPGTEIQNRILMDELVSHGFIVGSLTYPAKIAGISDAEYQAQVAYLRTALDLSSAAALRKTTEIFDQRVRDRALDAVAALDELRHSPLLDGERSPYPEVQSAGHQPR